MNRSILIAAAVAVVLAGAAMATPQAQSAAQGGHHPHMSRLDANNDGAIDATEAAAHPRLAAKFDTLDKNKDGKLDASERPSWKGKRGRHDRHDGMARVIKRDSNGDGRISKVEADASPKLAERFAAIDANRDGYLVRSELRASAERRRAEFAAKRQQRFEQKFTEADTNRDGKLSRVEVEATMPHLAKAFAFHDEDRDGYLMRADLEVKPRHCAHAVP